MRKIKPTIAVDLDEVLTAQNEAVRLFVNEVYNADFTPEDYMIEAPYWSYWETIWGVDTKEGKQRLNKFIKSGGLMKQQPIPGAINAISKLEENYHLVIVTSRKDEHADNTNNWLKKHYPAVFKGVLFTAAWGDNASLMKAKVCREIGASYLIDDNYEHCEMVAGVGIKALLFGEYGWNVNKKLLKNITRVKNWKEVMEFFNAESRRTV